MCRRTPADLLYQPFDAALLGSTLAYTSVAEALNGSYFQLAEHGTVSGEGPGIIAQILILPKAAA